MTSAGHVTVPGRHRAGVCTHRTGTRRFLFKIHNVRLQRCPSGHRTMSDRRQILSNLPIPVRAPDDARPGTGRCVMSKTVTGEKRRVFAEVHIAFTKIFHWIIFIRPVPGQLSNSPVMCKSLKSYDVSFFVTIPLQIFFLIKMCDPQIRLCLRFDSLRRNSSIAWLQSLLSVDSVVQRGPVFNSRLRQGFLCLIFSFVVVVILLFRPKTQYLSHKLKFILQY